jgi:predicted Zn-dependent protease
VFALVSVGLVELRHHQPRPVAPVPAAPPQPPELAAAEADLRAGRLDAAERRVGEALRRDPGRAELHLLLGRVELRRARWSRAAQHLHAAVQRDPLLARAYYALGLAAARQGDLPRAAEALETYLRLPEGSSQRRDRAVRAASLIAELQRLLDEDGDFKPGTT